MGADVMKLFVKWKILLIVEEYLLFIECVANCIILVKNNHDNEAANMQYDFRTILYDPSSGRGY